MSSPRFPDPRATREGTAPHGVVLAVDVGGTKVACGLYEPASDSWYARTRFPVRDAPQRPDKGETGPLLQVATVVDRIEACIRPFTPVTGVRHIGISIAAAISEDGRSIRYAPNLPGWDGPDLVRTLEARFSTSARLLQDGHATTLGECGRGALHGIEPGLCVAIGTGIGGGIVARGGLLSGADGLAGVAGYVPVLSEGRIVPLEQAIAGPGLARRARAAGLAVDPLALFEKARQGDLRASTLVATALRELAQALAAAVSLLNPQRIVLGGTLGLEYAKQAPALQGYVRELAQPTAAASAEIVPAALGRESALWGAALHAIDSTSVTCRDRAETFGQEKGAGTTGTLP